MNHKGYTLVELVVVVFLAGVMLFLAVPAMRNVLLGDPLQSSVRQLVGIVRDLRTDAVREQIDFVLHFDLPQNCYWIYTTNMTPEEKIERKKKALLIPEGIKISDIYHVGDVKKTDGEFDTIFYRTGVVQPTVIHLSRNEQVVTLIFEPFLNQVRIFERYVEFPGDGENS